MASKQPQNFAIGTLAGTGIFSLYKVPTNFVTGDLGLILTNNSNERAAVSVFINDGTQDFLLIKRTIPGGVGKAWNVTEIQVVKLNVEFEVKIKLDNATPIIFNLSGTEIDTST